MLFSCGGGSKENGNQEENGDPKKVEEPAENQKTEEPKKEEPKVEEPKNLLEDASTLQKAKDALKALPQFEGKELKVFQDIYFYDDGRIKLSLQDPNKPENIDHYEYDEGQWKEPVPVQISGGGNLEDNLFPLNEVKFETAVMVYKSWNEKAQEVEGHNEPLTSVRYALWVPNQTKEWKTGHIRGTRASYKISFNSDGTVKDFKKN